MSKLGLSLPTTTVPLCTDLALVAEHEGYVRELAKAEREPVKDDRENDPKSALVQKIRDLETQMESSTLTFTLQALPRKVFAEIEARYPVRKDNPDDERFNINMKKVPDAVLANTAPPSILSVVDAAGEKVDFTGADWNAEADSLSDGQWTVFALAVLALNRGTTAVPFSRAASRETRRSEQN